MKAPLYACSRSHSPFQKFVLSVGQKQQPANSVILQNLSSWVFWYNNSDGNNT